MDAWATPYDGPRRRALVPIWRRPWMAVGSGTFTGDVLARLGVDNVEDAFILAVGGGTSTEGLAWLQNSPG